MNKVTRLFTTFLGVIAVSTIIVCLFASCGGDDPPFIFPLSGPEIPAKLQGTTWSNPGGDTVSFTKDKATFTPAGGTPHTFTIKKIVEKTEINTITLYFSDSQSSDYIVISNNVVTSVNLDGVEKSNFTKNIPFPAAKGKMTINGLNDFNGNYVCIVLLAIINDETLLGDKIFSQISNGKVILPLYSTNSESQSYTAYDGNDTIDSLRIIIVDETNPLSFYYKIIDMRNFTSVSFINGNTTINWGPSGNTPPSGVTPIQLTENTWTDGTVSPSGDEQWFTFTAAAPAQWIHIITRDNNFECRIYDAEHKIKRTSTSKDINYPFIFGQTYYIKVSAMDNIYRIAYNNSYFPPITETLTADTWADVNIQLYGVQWFSFTATAETHYMHASFETETSMAILYVESYSSNYTGPVLEIPSQPLPPAPAHLSNNRKYIEGTLTAGQTYYIKVYLSKGDYTETYQIAFNTSDTPPSH